MEKPESIVEIVTLGRFSMYLQGQPVATSWPDEALQELFCSLLSPLDLFFTWDRLCRSMLGSAETQAGKRQLEIMFIQPLNSFLVSEFGFTPLIVEDTEIKIDRKRIRVDAHEFYRAVIEGLNNLAFGNYELSREKFDRAQSLYAGSYLFGVPGKMIENTRNELESLYRKAVQEGIRQLSEHTNKAAHNPERRIP